MAALRGNWKKQQLSLSTRDAVCNVDFESPVRLAAAIRNRNRYLGPFASNADSTAGKRYRHSCVAVSMVSRPSQANLDVLLVLATRNLCSLLARTVRHHPHCAISLRLATDSDRADELGHGRAGALACS